MRPKAPQRFPTWGAARCCSPKKWRSVGNRCVPRSPIPRGKRGPEAERVKIEGGREEAMKTALKAPPQPKRKNRSF